MTVKNEMEKGGTQQYKKILYVEFLEFIGRIAAEKYKTSGNPLYMKIEYVLDTLLSYAGVERKEMITEIEIDEPDSEESYEEELPDMVKEKS